MPTSGHGAVQEGRQGHHHPGRLHRSVGVIVDKDIIGDELTVALVGEDSREIRTHEAHADQVDDD